MTKSLPTFALTALLTLSGLCGCAAQCPRRMPLGDSPAPPPQMFSVCLRQILAYGQGQGPISPACSSFLQDGQTK